jgi:hypothetical protein
MLIEIACEKLTGELLIELQDIESWDLRHDLIYRKLMMASLNAFKLGQKKTGGQNKRKVIQMNLIGQPIKMYESAKEASRMTNVNHSHILQVCHKYKSCLTAGGFKWKFADEKYNSHT